MVKLDLRFVFLERELGALEEFLQVIEPQVSWLRAQDDIQTHARLKEQGLDWDDGDLQLELQYLDQRATTIFPRLLRNPFLVGLWAAYENGVKEIGDDLKRTTESMLGIRDVRGDDFIDGARKYYSVVGVPLDLDPKRLDRLRDISKLRNIIAHANGEQRSVGADKWKAVESVVGRVPTVTVTDGYLILSAEYIAEAYRDVSDSLGDLIDRVRGPVIQPD